MPPLPTAPTLDTSLEVARQMRALLDDSCDQAPCAVCSMYRPTVNLSTHTPDCVPHLDLLAADGPSSDKHPRIGLTTFSIGDVKYCLQKAACHVDVNAPAALDEEGVVHEPSVQLDVCQDCMRSLKHETIPKASLVCFDTGKCP